MDKELAAHLETLGKNISKMRKKKNMTQYKLAKETFMDQSNLARIEEGKVNPTIKTMLRISAVLNCKVKDLVEF